MFVGASTLMLDGVAVAADAVNGWAWSDGARGTVTLPGQACTAARASSAATVEVVVTCATDASVPVVGP